MTNPYYDKRLHNLCRETMRNLLRLYFEFAFKIDTEDTAIFPDRKEISPEFIRKMNTLAMEIEDENIEDERLMTIWLAAIEQLEKDNNLTGFCKLPTLFMKNDFGLPYGDKIWEEFGDDFDNE